MIILFFLRVNRSPLCIFTTYSLFSHFLTRRLDLVTFPGSCKQCLKKHEGASIYKIHWLRALQLYIQECCGMVIQSSSILLCWRISTLISIFAKLVFFHTSSGKCSYFPTFSSMLVIIYFLGDKHLKWCIFGIILQ